MSGLDEATALLQQLIRNRCVNDGTVDSGGEVRNAETLAAYLAGPGVEIERYEPHPGRGSLVSRIEGRDPKAPSLLLMGHLDVVPADPTGWERDPFCGDLVDGEVWGRGALDMLCITATMAVAVKTLLRGGFRPKGTLLFSGMADEESLGTWGAEWLVTHRWEDVRADLVLTESGSPPLPLPSRGPQKAGVTVAEKGSHWLSLRVRGAPGHGSMPYKADNALAKAAEVIRRLVAYRPPLHLGGLWREFVRGLELAPELESGLLSEEGFAETIDRLPASLAKLFDAAAHTTFSPNILHSGTKTNIIPDSALLAVDVRTVPGDGPVEVQAMLREAIGDLWAEVEIVDEHPDPATASATDTAFFRRLREVSQKVAGMDVVPGSTTGATDSRFFRRKGVPAYGYSAYSAKIPFAEHMTMVHGRNERIDQDSLALMLELYEQTVRAFLG